eukprot:5605842-Alexandrium_andersonii.AAC.1
MGVVRGSPGVRVPAVVRDLRPEMGRKDPGLLPGLAEGGAPGGSPAHGQPLGKDRWPSAPDRPSWITRTCPASL